MALRCQHRPRPDDYVIKKETLISSGWLLDEEINQLMDNVRDPFATYVDPSSYWDHTQEFEVNECLDSIVAGIAERLGFPAGLTFEEVFGYL